MLIKIARAIRAHLLAFKFRGGQAPRLWSCAALLQISSACLRKTQRLYLLVCRVSLANTDPAPRSSASASALGGLSLCSCCAATTVSVLVISLFFLSLSPSLLFVAPCPFKLATQRLFRLMVRDSRPTVTSAALRRSRVNARAVLLVLEQLFLANVPEIPAEDQEQVSVRLETGGRRSRHPSRDVALRVKEKGG